MFTLYVRIAMRKLQNLDPMHFELTLTKTEKIHEHMSLWTKILQRHLKTDVSETNKNIRCTELWQKFSKNYS